MPNPNDVKAAKSVAESLSSLIRETITRESREESEDEESYREGLMSQDNNLLPWIAKGEEISPELKEVFDWWFDLQPSGDGPTMAIILRRYLELMQKLIPFLDFSEWETVY